jgi:hypothetical protein
MSKCGSKIGRFVSGTHMPLWVDMVAREGEWGGFLVTLLLTKDGAKVSERSGGDHALRDGKTNGQNGVPTQERGFNEVQRDRRSKIRPKTPVWGGQYLTH